MKFFGFFVATLFSSVCGIFMGIGIHLILGNALVSFSAFAIIFFIILIFSIKNAFVPVNHRGLPIFFGRRWKNFEFAEGINGWLPKPFGDVITYDMRIQDPVNLSFSDKKSITLSDGTKLESAEISIIWRRMPGKLFEITTIGGEIPPYIRELAEDRIRNSAIAITAGFDPDIKEKHYHGLDALVLEQSISRWQEVISYGHLKKPEEGKSPESAFDDEEIRRIKESGKRILETPDSGIISAMAEVGIEITHVTISSAKLPDKLRQTIDNLVLEPIEKKREKENMGSLIEQAKRLHTETGMDKETSVLAAMLEKGTGGVKIHSVRGSGSGSDKIAAGLFDSKGDPIE